MGKNKNMCVGHFVIPVLIAHYWFSELFPKYVILLMAFEGKGAGRSDL